MQNVDAKKEKLKKLISKDGFINALAIDQRGALKRMLGEEASEKTISEFKKAVSSELTKYSSAILLDPEYGWEAAKARYANVGLLMAYEKTGYDKTERGRLPDLLNTWSVHRLKEKGADGIKLLLYYDVDESEEINDQKKAFVERVGSECMGEGLPYFLEILTYDEKEEDTKSSDYARLKPGKVIEAMKEFSSPRYAVDVLKVEVPVNMEFVEGFGEHEIFSQEEAAEYFRQQSNATTLPFIFLSAGVSASLFQDTLQFAKNAGSTYNGVLCGRATWSGATNAFLAGGEKQAAEWLKTEGYENIEALNKVVRSTAVSCEKQAVRD